MFSKFFHKWQNCSLSYDLIAPRVAAAVAQAAIDTGVATRDGMTAELVAEHTMEMLGA